MTKAQEALLKGLSDELKNFIVQFAEELKPAIDEIHKLPPTSKNYYSEYMAILSHKPKYKKIVALSMLYVGCSPEGIENAMKFV